MGVPLEQRFGGGDWDRWHGQPHAGDDAHLTTVIAEAPRRPEVGHWGGFGAVITVATTLLVGQIFRSCLTAASRER